VLELSRAALDALVLHCLAAMPHEGCGLLVGDASRSVALEATGARNVARSALVYELDPRDHLRIDRDASDRGLDVIGAFHSHTHTDAWPSATDVALAVDASWHWVIVSFRHPAPLVRSFLIIDGHVGEEPVVVG
jgi:proteasome lid subunit RPN8/RPN11